MVKNRTISSLEVLSCWQLSEKYDTWWLEFKKHYTIVQELKYRPELKASESELNFQRESFLKQRKIQDLDRWLKHQNIKKTELNEKLEYLVRLKKLKDKVVSPKIQDYFIKNCNKFELVELSRIVIESQDLAEEIYDSVIDNESTFESEVIENSRNRNQITQELQISQPLIAVPTPIRLELDEIQAGEISKPIYYNNLWYIVRLERRIPASLKDQKVRQKIENEIFDFWILEKAKSLSLSIFDIHECESI